MKGYRWCKPRVCMRFDAPGRGDRNGYEHGESTARASMQCRHDVRCRSSEGGRARHLEVPWIVGDRATVDARYGSDARSYGNMYTYTAAPAPAPNPRHSATNLIPGRRITCGFLHDTRKEGCACGWGIMRN
jgi:hypothetical protein